MENSVVIEAGPEALEEVRGLWVLLNAHHMAVSPHFSRQFQERTFDARKAELLQKASGGTVRIFLARPADGLSGGAAQGYCAAILDRDERGEIESLFVDPSHRGCGLGEALIRAALSFLETNGAREISVAVVCGNEAAHGFYRRFGLVPSRTILVGTAPGKKGRG